MQGNPPQNQDIQYAPNPANTKGNGQQVEAQMYEAQDPLQQQYLQQQ